MKDIATLLQTAVKKQKTTEDQFTLLSIVLDYCAPENELGIAALEMCESLAISSLNCTRVLEDAESFYDALMFTDLREAKHPSNQMLGEISYVAGHEIAVTKLLEFSAIGYELVDALRSAGFEKNIDGPELN